MELSKGINIKKGGITVYLSLVLLVILSLIFVCMDSVRLSCGRSALSCSVDEGLFSLFSNFDKTLYEDYGLLFLDGGYSGKELKIGTLISETTGYVQKVISPANGIFAVTPEKLYRLSLGSACVTGYTLATDSDYAPLKNQITELMTGKLGADALKRLSNSLDSYSAVVDEYSLENEGEIDDIIEKYETQKEKAQELAERIEYGDEETDYSNESDVVVPDNYKNPLDNISKLKKLGIMALALPSDSKVSASSADLSQMASGRTLRQGMGLMPSSGSKTAQKLLVSEYALDFFPNFLNAENTDALQYQAEYVIAGKSTDALNLKTVMTKLLLIREGLNYLHLLSSSDKKQEVYAAASIISAIILSPWALEVIAQMIMLCWAYAESMQDIKCLLSGEKVPLFKSASTWKVSFSLMASMNADTKTDKKSSGLSYSDYLRILMNMTSENIVVKRTADMIEYNKRIKDKAESFCLDSCLESFEIEYNARAGGHDVSVNRNYGYYMQ